MNRQLLSLTLLAAALVGTSHAQVVYSGGNYTQNFSSLSTSTGTAQTWTNGSTLSGWHATSSGGGNFTAYTPQWQSGISAGDLFHARNTTETGRSFLGVRTTSGIGNATIGLALENSTGSTLTGFNISFLASQFHKTGVAQELQFSFSTDATSLTTGTWTTIDALTYTAPYTTGNAQVSAQEEIDSRLTLSIAGQAVNWENGTDLWMRWTSFRDLSGDYSAGAAVLAINDVSFTAIPEPTTGALLALGIASLTILRRRRRA